MMRNNTFVTVTDSKGKKKLGASSGMLPEMKGGAKLSRYSTEMKGDGVVMMLNYRLFCSILNVLVYYDYDLDDEIFNNI